MKLCLQSDLCAVWTITPDNLNLIDPQNELSLYVTYDSLRYIDTGKNGSSPVFDIRTLSRENKRQIVVGPSFPEEIPTVRGKKDVALVTETKTSGSLTFPSYDDFSKRIAMIGADYIIPIDFSLDLDYLSNLVEKEPFDPNNIPATQTKNDEATQQQDKLSERKPFVGFNTLKNENNTVVFVNDLVISNAKTQKSLFYKMIEDRQTRLTLMEKQFDCSKSTGSLHNKFVRHYPSLDAYIQNKEFLAVEAKSDTAKTIITENYKETRPEYQKITLIVKTLRELLIAMAVDDSKDRLICITDIPQRMAERGIALNFIFDWSYNNNNSNEEDDESTMEYHEKEQINLKEKTGSGESVAKTMVNNSKKESEDIILYMRSNEYKMSKETLLPKEICPLPCCHRPRAYIHHLLDTHELTGFALLTMHNIYSLIRLKEEFKRHTKKEIFKVLGKYLEGSVF